MLSKLKTCGTSIILIKNKIHQSKDRQIYKEGFVSLAKIWKNLNNGGKVWLKNLKKI